MDKIIKNNTKVPILPINGVQISNAVGKKICRTSRQIYCECRIGSAILYVNFVQVENLNEKGIIGADILQQYNTQINFHNRTIMWSVNQTIHTTRFAETEPKIITEDHQMHQIQINSNDEEGEHYLSDDQQNEFAQLLKQYKNIFSPHPGKIEKYQCQIRVKEGKPKTLPNTDVKSC